MPKALFGHRTTPNCPKCGVYTYTLESRKKDGYIRRRYECGNEHRFTGIEKDGVEELFIALPVHPKKLKNLAKGRPPYPPSPTQLAAWARSRHDLTGKVYGRLTAIAVGAKPNTWLCSCDCGTLTEVTSANLRSGNTRSCGCLYLETILHNRKKRVYTKKVKL